jgi:hypothetical protein
MAVISGAGKDAPAPISSTLSRAVRPANRQHTIPKTRALLLCTFNILPPKKINIHQSSLIAGVNIEEKYWDKNR